MNIAIILASGCGSRIKSTNTPKQFIKINGKPLIVYTLEPFVNNPKIDHIVVACNTNYKNMLNGILKKYFSNILIYVCDGSLTRNLSLQNAILFANKKFNLKNADNILTHDAARMFITGSIIDKHLKKIDTKNTSVISTAINSIDTINIIENKKILMPIKKSSFIIQTPQTFKFSVLKNLFIQTNTDFNNSYYASADPITIAFNNQFKIDYVLGSYNNIKITTDFDLKLAEFILSSKIYK